MTSRIILIGCGGIGSQLAGPLIRYLASRPEPHALLVLVDGDAFEAGNLGRQACAVGDLGTNKAEALARVARSAGLAVGVITEYVTSANAGQIVREGTWTSSRSTTRRGPGSTGTSRPSWTRRSSPAATTRRTATSSSCAVATRARLRHRTGLRRQRVVADQALPGAPESRRAAQDATPRPPPWSCELAGGGGRSSAHRPGAAPSRVEQDDDGDL